MKVNSNHLIAFTVEVVMKIVLNQKRCKMCMR